MRFFAGLLAAAVSAPAIAEPPPCTTAGERIQWIADYCMAKLQTDDEIPAADCIAKENARTFKNDCVAKLHFKRLMCDVSIHDKRHPGPLDACLRDPDFMGRTVRRGGVGG